MEIRIRMKEGNPKAHDYIGEIQRSSASWRSVLSTNEPSSMFSHLKNKATLNEPLIQPYKIDTTSHFFLNET